MKSRVVESCHRILNARISALRQQLHDLVEGAKNDSKSTAGDKHETSRAMMQLEQEKLGAQLKILESQQQVLQRLDTSLKPEVIVSGSLVNTNRGWIFISIPLGKIRVDENDVMCISAQSPLGGKLLGLVAGQETQINNMSYKVIDLQ